MPFLWQLPGEGIKSQRSNLVVPSLCISSVRTQLAFSEPSLLSFLVILTTNL